MRAMLPKVTTDRTTTAKQQKRSKLLGSGVYLPRFTYYDPEKTPSTDPSIDPADRAEAQATVINNGMEFGIQGGLDIPLEGAFGAVEGMTVEPVSITFFKGGESPVLRYANTQSGQIERLAIDPSQYSIINRYLDEEFGVTFDELRARANQLYPETADSETQQPTRRYPLLSDAPGEQMPATTTLSVEEPADTVRVQSTVTPDETGFEVTASPGQSPGEYGVQTKTQERRVQALENPESLKLKVREDYNISPFVTRTQEDMVFRNNLRDILNDPAFQSALVQAGYVDFRGVVGYFSDEERDKAMLTALDSMGDDKRAVYVKEFIQANKDRF